LARIKNRQYFVHNGVAKTNASTVLHTASVQRAPAHPNSAAVCRTALKPTVSQGLHIVWPLSW